jgi:GntR family transcriptional regulator
MDLTLNQANSYPVSIPLYIQIAEGLIAQIASGELTPQDRLPSERELSEELGVTRMTLRRALGVLESQGLIIRVHGVGTYIAEPKIERQMEKVFRFSSKMQERGFNPGAKIISIERIVTDRALSMKLALLDSSPVYSILRLRSINKEPVMLESYAIPEERFPGLDRYDLEGRSIYEVMEIEYNVSILRARQSFEPVIATTFEAELLNIPVGDALMLEKRLSYDEDNIPIEYGVDRYRGDRFRFVTEAEPLDL